MTIQEEIKALESLIQHGKNTGQEQGVWMERSGSRPRPTEVSVE